MEAQDVLCRVFRADPQNRIALAALRKHPWLTDGISAELAQGMPLHVLAPGLQKVLSPRPSIG